MKNEEATRASKSRKSWFELVGALFIIAIVVVNIWSYVFDDNMESVEETTSELIIKALKQNDEFKKIARVCKVEEVNLVKEGSGNTYKGHAKVSMQAREKGSPDNNIQYGGDPINVNYSLKVICDGRNVMLDEAKMDDNDMTKLIMAAGVQDAQNGNASSSPDQTTPEKAVESYFCAIEDIDVDSMISLVDSDGDEWTRLQKENLAKSLMQQKASWLEDGITMGSVIEQTDVLQDGRVRVAVSVTDSDGKTRFTPITVKKVGEKWYIDQ